MVLSVTYKPNSHLSSERDRERETGRERTQGEFLFVYKVLSTGECHLELSAMMTI